MTRTPLERELSTNDPAPVELDPPAEPAPDGPPSDQAAGEPPGPAEDEAVGAGRVLTLATDAPTIGKVLPAPTGTGASRVPFRQSGLSLDSLFMGEYHVAAGSMAGAGHLATGAPRQDAYDFALTSSGRLVIAIADGMGSRPNSQVGARLFCEAVTRLASAHGDRSASAYLIGAAIEAARMAQGVYSLTPDDISFVAAVAVLDPDGFEVARVGDVSAFALDPEAPFVELFANDEGHINVVHNGLPSAEKPLPETVTGGYQRPLILTTDGLANDLRTSEAVRSWLFDCWRAPVDAYRMADALRYRRRGSHDDRTAVVVSFGFDAVDDRG